MPLLLVDERDGRIVAELEGEDEALQLLGSMASGQELPDYLSIVAFRDWDGATVSVQSYVAARPL